MKRRNFLNQIIATGAAVGVVPQILGQTNGKETSTAGFNLKYAPHIGMFNHLAGEDPVEQLHFMADKGFEAFEDNGMKNRSEAMQHRMAKTMTARNMAMGVFVAHKIYWNEPNLASGDPNLRMEFLKQIEASVEVAKRVNAKWMTVVPGHCDFRQKMEYQTAHVIESLKRACDILEPHGLTMVLEPLNFRDHPGLFLTESPQAYKICRAVDSPSCKILFDIYHQQVQEGNLIPNIENCWDEIAYFQIGDNPGRKEPTTGEINYKNVFKYIHGKGYSGILGMEHGNHSPGKAGEEALIEAYRKTDQFL